MTPSSGRDRDFPWRSLTLGTLILAAVILVWTTGRGDEPEFPEALVTALGFLLTTLVFMLGLARARAPIDVWGPAEHFPLKWELRGVNEQLTPGDGDGSGLSDKKRSQLERRRDELRTQIEELRTADDNAGVTTHGFARLRGRAEVAEISARSLVRFSTVFSFLMAVLVGIGLIYSGWDLDQSVTPEMWSALVLVALALTHSYVVNKEINSEVQALSLELQDLSLLVLYDGEQVLGLYWESVLARQESLPLRRAVRERIDQAGQQVPGSHWLASLRGRLALADAVKADQGHIGADFTRAHDARMLEDLCQQLPVAVRLLGFAASRKDDPGADLGYARALYLAADLTDEGVFTQVPFYCHAETSAALRSRAQEHAEHALQLLHHLPKIPRGLFELPHRAWFSAQSFLWPEWDEDAVRELRELLLIDPPDEQQDDHDDNALW